MRDPARIDRILAKLGRYWRANPDLRLGQLISNLYGGTRQFVAEDPVGEEALDLMLRELTEHESPTLPPVSFTPTTTRAIDPQIDRIAVMDLPAPLPEGPEVLSECYHLIVDDDVQRFLLARRALGIARYGQPLHRDDGRPRFVDAAQEAGDLLVYTLGEYLRANAAGDHAQVADLIGEIKCIEDLLARMIGRALAQEAK